MSGPIPAFEPIVTERLVLRLSELGDLDSLVERRNHRDVARYQDWELPYPRERALKRLEQVIEMGGPQPDTGWSMTVTLNDEAKTIVGDLAFVLSWGRRTALVGYSFDPDHWGNGYAVEATEALIEYAFDDLGVHRVESSLHPDNFGSSRVLEGCGLLFEGETRGSFWVGDEVSDDHLYGMLRPDWDQWRNRPRHLPERITLEPLTPQNAKAVGALATHKSQERFVAPMANNLRVALVPPIEDGAPLVPWYRAIVADGEVVGFIMASETTEAHPEPYLWRFLVDRVHQRRGIGSVALDLFEQHHRDRGEKTIMVSWVEGIGSPASMYRSRGYEPTGEVEDGETVARKRLI